MPVEIKNVNGYSVRTPGGVKAKKTSRLKAESQKRLLQGVDRGWRPTGRPKVFGQSGKKYV